MGRLNNNHETAPTEKMVKMEKSLPTQSALEKHGISIAVYSKVTKLADLLETHGTSVHGKAAKLTTGMETAAQAQTPIEIPDYVWHHRHTGPLHNQLQARV